MIPSQTYILRHICICIQKSRCSDPIFNVYLLFELLKDNEYNDINKVGGHDSWRVER